MDEEYIEWITDPGWLCLDCGHHTGLLKEYYMVEDHVWSEVAPSRAGMLCVVCLEHRLGRLLTSADFKDVPLNSSPMWERSAILQDRLGR
jgi:hypothetical protein